MIKKKLLKLKQFFIKLYKFFLVQLDNSQLSNNFIVKFFSYIKTKFIKYIFNFSSALFLTKIKDLAAILRNAFTTSLKFVKRFFYSFFHLIMSKCTELNQFMLTFLLSFLSLFPSFSEEWKKKKRKKLLFILLKFLFFPKFRYWNRRIKKSEFFNNLPRREMQYYSCLEAYDFLTRWGYSKEEKQRLFGRFPRRSEDYIIMLMRNAIKIIFPICLVSLYFIKILVIWPYSISYFSIRIFTSLFNTALTKTVAVLLHFIDSWQYTPKKWIIEHTPNTSKKKRLYPYFDKRIDYRWIWRVDDNVSVRCREVFVRIRPPKMTYFKWFTISLETYIGEKLFRFSSFFRHSHFDYEARDMRIFYKYKINKWLRIKVKQFRRFFNHVLPNFLSAIYSPIWNYISSIIKRWSEFQWNRDNIFWLYSFPFTYLCRCYYSLLSLIFLKLPKFIFIDFPISYVKLQFKKFINYFLTIFDTKLIKQIYRDTCDNKIIMEYQFFGMFFIRGWREKWLVAPLRGDPTRTWPYHPVVAARPRYWWLRYNWKRMDVATYEKQYKNYSRWFKHYPRIKSFFLSQVMTWELRNAVYLPARILWLLLNFIKIVSWLSVRIYKSFLWSKFFNYYVKPLYHIFIDSSFFVSLQCLLFAPYIILLSFIFIMIAAPAYITVRFCYYVWCLPLHLFFTLKDFIVKKWFQKSQPGTRNSPRPPIFIQLKIFHRKLLKRNVFYKFFINVFYLCFLIPSILQFITFSKFVIKLLNPFLWINIAINTFFVFKEILFFFYHITVQFVQLIISICRIYYNWFSHQFLLLVNYFTNISFIIYFSFIYYSSEIKKTFFLFLTSFHNTTWFIFYNYIMNIFHFPHFFFTNFFAFLATTWSKFYRKLYDSTAFIFGLYIEKKQVRIFHPSFKGWKPLIKIKIKKREKKPTPGLGYQYPEPTKWDIIYNGHNISWKNFKKNFWYAWVNFPKFISRNIVLVATFIIFLPSLILLSFLHLTVLNMVWLTGNYICMYFHQMIFYPLTAKFLIIPLIRCAKFLLKIKILAFILFWSFVLLKPLFIYIVPALLKTPFLVTLYLNMHYYGLWYWCKKGWYIGMKSYSWYPLVQKKYFILKLFKLPFKLVAKKKAWFKTAYYFYKFYFSLGFFLWWTIDSTGFILLTVAQLFSLIIV